MRKYVLAVAVVLSVMLCFTGCFKKKEKSGLAYVPKSAAVVGAVNVTKLLSIQKVKEAAIEQEADSKNVELKKAGLSVEKVTNVSFGVDLSSVAEGKEPEFVAVIQLNAPVNDQKKVLELLKKDMGEKAQAQFLSDNLLAIGTAGMVNEAVKLKGGTGEAVTANADLMAVSEKGPKTGLVWVAGLVPEEQLEALAKNAPPGSKLDPKSFKDMFISGDYSDAAGLSIDVSVTFSSVDEAVKVMPTIEQAKGMASMFSGGKITAEMIKAEQKEAQVSISVKIPKKVLDELVEQATKKAETMPMMPSGPGMNQSTMPNMP